MARSSANRGMRRGSPLRSTRFSIHTASREWRRAWEVTEALVNRARASSEALGAELLVVCAPSQFQIDDAAWRTLIGSDRASVMARYRQDVPNRRLEEAAARAGARFVDLLPGMRKAAGGFSWLRASRRGGGGGSITSGR